MHFHHIFFILVYMQQYSYLEATFNNIVFGMETQSHAAKVLFGDLIDWLFTRCLASRSNIFHSHWDFTIADEWL